VSLSFDFATQDAIRFAVPLWLAGRGETVVQRSGVLNIGIEGMMLAGALTGWAVGVATGSAVLALLAAATAAMVLAALFALATLVFDADQVVCGTALNLVAVGATSVGFKWCQAAGYTARVAPAFPRLELNLPFDAFDQFPIAYATIALALLLHVYLRHMRWGVELTALGEYPAAAVAAGIRVRTRRFIAILFGGATAGLAGAYLSLMLTGQFGEHMTAGRGFLALAMVIFGRWQPPGLLLAGLFFGYLYAIQNTLEVSRPAWLPAPQLLQMMPYVCTLIVLAGLAGRTRAPSALGQPLERT
jgi:ABC-type uncharacterized transport system permease subunit